MGRMVSYQSASTLQTLRACCTSLLPSPSPAISMASSPRPSRRFLSLPSRSVQSSTTSAAHAPLPRRILQMKRIMGCCKRRKGHDDIYDGNVGEIEGKLYI